MPFNDSLSFPNCTSDGAVLSEYFEVEYTRVCSDILIVVICLLGLIGNTLSGLIFTRPGHNLSIDCILLALTISDSLFLLTAFLMSLFQTIDTLAPRFFPGFFEHFLPYPYYLSGVAQTATFLLVMTLSWERYLVVCYPMKARRICTWKKARNSVFAIYGISFLLNLPRFFVVAVDLSKQETSSGETGTNATIPMESYTSLEISRLAMDFVLILVNILFPFASLLYCHTKIYLKISASNKSREALTCQQVENIQITKMLVGVVVLFLISHSILIVDTAHGLLSHSNSPILAALSNVMYTINSALNFPIYVLTGKKFREEVKIVIFRKTTLPR